MHAEPYSRASLSKAVVVSVLCGVARSRARGERGCLYVGILLIISPFCLFELFIILIHTAQPNTQVRKLLNTSERELHKAQQQELSRASHRAPSGSLLLPTCLGVLCRVQRALAEPAPARTPRCSGCRMGPGLTQRPCLLVNPIRMPAFRLPLRPPWCSLHRTGLSR